MYLLAEIPPNTWIAIVIVLVVILYAVVRPMVAKKDPLTRNPPKYASLASQRTVEREMQNVLVELSKMTRQISAQLDTRSAKLEALLTDADKKITELKSLATGAQIFAPLATINEAQPEETHPGPMHADIYSLADEGKSAQDIAQKLNRPAGEVELILALRR